MNTTAIDKIRSRYNPEHDLGGDAPIHWSVMELAELVADLIAKVEELETQPAATRVLRTVAPPDSWHYGAAQPAKD